MKDKRVGRKKREEAISLLDPVPLRKARNLGLEDRLFILFVRDPCVSWLVGYTYGTAYRTERRAFGSYTPGRIFSQMRRLEQTPLRRFY